MAVEALRLDDDGPGDVELLRAVTRAEGLHLVEAAVGPEVLDELRLVRVGEVLEVQRVEGGLPERVFLGTFF